MSHGKRIWIELALAWGLLVPVGIAQKPPAPAPPPSPSPSPPPSRAGANPAELSREDLVMFLFGRVATDDGTSVPSDVMVERVCNDRVRQQVYATYQGDFSMQLGSMADSFLDASGDRGSLNTVPNKTPGTGISKRELANCELRASVSGFYSSTISLVDLTTLASNVDVGAIVIHRGTKVKEATLSVTPYKAPRDARKAYEKGVDAESNGKLADARKHFEQAVAIYSRYVSAWFQLGTVLVKEKHNDAARAAFIRAATIDTRFLPPYLSLARMAYAAEDWTEVLTLTGHILDLDPWKHAPVNGYFLDLDQMDSAEAYFCNAVANYKLNKIEDAEKSGLKAEYGDLRNRFPQLHLLLAEIFAREKKYAAAILEIESYLELVPQAKNRDQLQQRLAKLRTLNSPVSSKETSIPK